MAPGGAAIHLAKLKFGSFLAKAPVTDDAVRDAEGRIIGCRALARV